ncbi:DUF5718 family protein [Patulibacter sp. NPDC049589]|uniref:DUF5718 family protein n=1 Tax=Patulibacter sp. NPDC049589 TaxID=3154731 RepID=UPI0034427E50
MQSPPDPTSATDGRPPIRTDLEALRGAFGFGVAGNFAGHLEQAGEASDFVGVAAEAGAPKGIFPFYVPGGDTFLGAFPLATDRTLLPLQDEPANLQLEPEVGILCRVAYGQGGGVEALEPFGLGAFNDCSIRRPGATKISEKKNWGAASKGVAAELFAIEDLDPAGPTRDFRLASFLRRDGETHDYGIDSPVPGYSYYGAQLVDWIVERLAHQEGGDGTPLEPVGAYLRAARPELVLIGIGATRYTDYGETTFLRDGDVSFVVVYDGAQVTPEQVRAAIAADDTSGLPGASVLRQAVTSG